MGLDDLEI
jgi:hypothetical protein